MKRASLGLWALLLSVSPLAWGAPARFQATVSVDLSRPIGEINPHIYGQYLEHVDTSDECIYPSIWDNTSPLADEMGLRKDVMDATRTLGTPIVRWPGGCFADVYVWENGIGPRERRPTLAYKFWPGMESHQFGTDEFLTWCERSGVTPYVNVNHGSGTLDEALRWLEYCNGSAETEQGKRRAANGRVEPYGVRFWGIGNETWGEWEVGHSDAKTYARRLAEWARAMREQDPSIQLLAVGSNAGNDPEWDRTVLAEAGELIDYLTLHVYGYTTGSPDDYERVAYTPAYLESRMKRMVGTIEQFAHEKGLTKPIRVSIDEWNIRHCPGGGKLVRRDPRQLQDAVFAAGMLNAMIRLSPRIGMANYVFLVNGNATMLVDADQVVKTPLYHLFQQYTKHMRGEAIAVSYDGPRIMPPDPLFNLPLADGTSPKVAADYQPEPVAVLDSAAALDSEEVITLVLVNRDRAREADIALKLPAGYVVKRSWTLADEDVLAANDFEHPDRVVPVSRSEKMRESWRCPPHSVVMLRCARE